MKKYLTDTTKYVGKTKCWIGDYLVYCAGGVITRREACTMLNGRLLKQAGAAKTDTEPGELVEFHIPRGEKILKGLFELLEN